MTPEEEAQKQEYDRLVQEYLADVRQKMAPKITDIYALGTLEPFYVYIYGTCHWTETHDNMRTVHPYQVSHSEKRLLHGVNLRTGEIDEPGPLYSKLGLVESEGLGPIDWALGIKAMLSIARLAIKVVLARALVKAAGSTAGADCAA